MGEKVVNVSVLKFRASNHCFVGLPRSWRLQRSASVVTFSVVCVSSGVDAHFSWNGDESDEDCLLVNSHVASRLGFKEGDEVVVCRVHAVPLCSMVVLKPVSKGDWQILELNVSRVEHCLLGQIRVLWSNLVFPIWVQPSVCAYVRVESTSPSSRPVELRQSTEVHVIPEIELPPPLPSRTVATPKPTSMIGSLMNMVINAAGMGTSEETPREDEDLTEEDFDDLPLLKISARVIGTATKVPQTEITLFSNKVFRRRLVAVVGRLETPQEVELRKRKPQDPNVSVDAEATAASLIQGSVLCSIRVLPNPWSNDNLALCPLPLRRRLGLEDCSRILLTITTETLEQIKAIALHPVINTRSVPESIQELQSLFKSALGTQATLLSNGCFLQIGECGYIVAVDKSGWLADDTAGISISKGEQLAARSTLNCSHLLPIVNLQAILRTEVTGSIDEIGGYGCVVKEIQDFIVRCVGHDRVCNRPLLVTGSRGVGKTHMTTTVARDVCRKEGLWLEIVSCGPLRGKRSQTLFNDWSKTLDEAFFRAPSVVIFDDLDALCGQAVGPEAEAGHDGLYFAGNSRIFIELLHRARHNNVCVIVTACSWSSLCGALTRTEGLHLFADTLELRPPAREERLDIFKVLCRRRGLDVGDVSDFVRRTEGFVARDLATLSDKVLLAQASRETTSNEGTVTMDVVEPILASITPLSLRGLNVERAAAHGAAGGWDAVGSMTEQKELLRETFLWPTRYPELLAQCPIRPVSGLLLYGMPGTGKTLLASCVAREADLNFISVKGPELLSKYIGASEQAVRDVFLRAKSAAPCVIFFDEFDSMAPRRGHDSTGVTDRCVNQLLTLLDGVETDASGVAVLAATSRPDLIDPALLRPGRLDKSVECPIPPDAEARLSILHALSERLSAPLASDAEEELKLIAEKAENFTGADLQALLFNAQLAALQAVDAIGTADYAEDPGPSGDSFRKVEDEPDFSDVAYAPTLSQGFVQLTPDTINGLPEPDREEILFHLSHRQGNVGSTGLLNRSRYSSKNETLTVSAKNLRDALKNTRPSLSRPEIEKFRAIYMQFRGEEPDLPPEQRVVLKPRATLA